MPHLPLCTKFPPSQSPSAYLYWVNHSRCVNSLLDYGHNPKTREFNTHITGYIVQHFKYDLKKTYLNRIKGAPLSSVERKHYEAPLQHRHVYLSLSLSLSLTFHSWKLHAQRPRRRPRRESRRFPYYTSGCLSQNHICIA